MKKINPFFGACDISEYAKANKFSVRYWWDMDIFMYYLVSIYAIIYYIIYRGVRTRFLDSLTCRWWATLLAGWNYVSLWTKAISNAFTHNFRYIFSFFFILLQLERGVPWLVGFWLAKLRRHIIIYGARTRFVRTSEWEWRFRLVASIL